MPLDIETPYCDQAYLIMILICMFFYTFLVTLGAQFLFLFVKYKNLLFWLIAIEVAYFISLGFLWRLDNQDLARSIGAATGVANGGLMFQVMSGFIIWAPILLYWASKKAQQ